MNMQDNIKLMKEYLLMKYQQGDWHGVADAAMDIREMEAQLRVKK